MKLYTKIVPHDLALLLKDAGYKRINKKNTIGDPTYGQVIDWLATKGLFIGSSILRLESGMKYASYISDLREHPKWDISNPYKDSWDESLSDAIAKALKLLNGADLKDLCK